MRKRLPSLPTRSCPKKTGPSGSSTLIAMATITKSQLSMTSTAALNAMSKKRLRKRKPKRPLRSLSAAAVAVASGVSVPIPSASLGFRLTGNVAPARRSRLCAGWRPSWLLGSKAAPAALTATAPIASCVPAVVMRVASRRVDWLVPTNAVTRPSPGQRGRRPALGLNKLVGGGGYTVLRCRAIFQHALAHPSTT